ncbi:MAG: ECF-type sigma factor, partial [Planctomycetota bacterium]
RIPLDDVEISIDGDPEDLLALDRALTELQARNPRMHDVVMLRHFAGLTSEQAAKSLGLSARTIKRDWSCARLWLVEAMRDEASRGGS